MDFNTLFTTTIDWPLLCQQKQALLEVTHDDANNLLTGLTNLLDQVFDIAEDYGLLSFGDLLRSGCELNCALLVAGYDMGANLVWNGTRTFTAYGEAKYQELLDAHYSWVEDGDISLQCDNVELGLDLILLLRHAQSEIEYNKVFEDPSLAPSKSFDLKREIAESFSTASPPQPVEDRINTAAAQLLQGHRRTLPKPPRDISR